MFLYLTFSFVAGPAVHSFLEGDSMPLVALSTSAYGSSPALKVVLPCKSGAQQTKYLK